MFFFSFTAEAPHRIARELELLLLLLLLLLTLLLFPPSRPKFSPFYIFKIQMQRDGLTALFEAYLLTLP